MTAAEPIGTINGCNLLREPGGVAAWRGTELVGVAFAAEVAKPEGRWFGKRRAEDAVLFDTRREAVAHIVDCRPEDVPGGESDG